MKYRKKPIVIEAMQWDGSEESAKHIQEWSGNVVCYQTKSYLLESEKWVDAAKPWMDIETLEGTMDVSPGDYVIRGIKGEFYPCKPDIFEASYEKVEE